MALDGFPLPAYKPNSTILNLVGSRSFLAEALDYPPRIIQFLKKHTHTHTHTQSPNSVTLNKLLTRGLWLKVSHIFLFFICLSLQAQREQLGFLALLMLDAFKSKLEWLIINCRMPYFKCILDVYVQRVSNAHIWFSWAIYHFTKSDASDLKKL